MTRIAHFCLAVLIAVVALSRALPAQSDAPGDFATEHKAASADLVKGMLGLATWANEKELFLERDRVYRAVLDVDPSNADARKGLRYSRKSDGSWQEPAPREAKNRNAKALVEELPAKRAAVAEPFEKRMLAAFTAYSVDEPTKRAVYKEILDADPENAFVHTTMGEARVDDRWVLGETVTAKQRRADIAAMAKAALDDVGELKDATLTDAERALAIKWSQARMTKNVRVIGTVQPEEIEKIARNCEAAGRFFRAVMGADTLHREGFTIYDMVSPKEGQTFADTLPGVDPEFRKSLKASVGALVAGMPIVAAWDKESARRIDGASRQTFGDFLSRTYNMVLDPGWAWEGMGLYLNGALAGTRLTWFIPLDNKDPEQKKLQKKLTDPATDWMSEAQAMLQRPEHPKLGAVLAKADKAMTPEDLLYAYAFSAYLVEGRPKEVSDILHRLSSGKTPSADVLAAVSKMDVPTLEERFERWVAERH
jgi:hypothetical protein